MFTWPEYPITAYVAQLYRSSREEPVYQWRVINDTETIIQMQLVQPFISQLEECEELTFSVRAVNSLGQGEEGNITGGLPKENGIVTFLTYSHEILICLFAGLTFYNSTVRATVQFSPNLQPNVQFVIPVRDM